MEPRAGPRAAGIAARLRRAADDLIALVEGIDEASWRHVPGPGVWSISKDAEHVADAAVLHQWNVRRTIGAAGPRRPAVERRQLTSDRSPAEVAALIRGRTEESVRLVLALTDAQLSLPTRPPRARGQRLAETIELVLIGHYDAHRAEIEAKLAQR